MLVVAVLIVLAICLLWGWFARMDGGAPPVTPEIVERLLCISPFVFAVTPYANFWSVLALAGMVGLATGHGQYFLRRILKAVSPETFDFVVRWFFGDDWRTAWPKNYVFSATQKIEYENEIRPRLYWRCVFGMFVTGSLVGLPAAIIAASHGQWLSALLLSQTGTIKALSYIFGEWLFQRGIKTGVPNLDAGTEISEFSNGFARTGLAIAAFLCAAW